MSIRSMVNDYLDKIVDARFKRDGQGRLVFFPWGFGTGRLVTDATVEASLRRAYRRLMIAIFVLVIPAMSAFNGFYQLTGIAFLAFVAACTALGFALQFYLVWLSRHLPRSDERMSYPAAVAQSLDRFGRKFLIFGLTISIVLAAGAAVMAAYPPVGAGLDRVAMIVCVLVFAPLAVVYAVALWRRRNGDASSA